MPRAERITIDNVVVAGDIVELVFEVQAAAEDGDDRIMWLGEREAMKLAGMLQKLGRDYGLIPVDKPSAPVLRIVRES